MMTKFYEEKNSQAYAKDEDKDKEQDKGENEDEGEVRCEKNSQTYADA